MTEQIIGKVMMTFKGDYDDTKQYNFLDTVEYNGSSFVCKANGTHDTPSEHSANWQLLAKAGRDGRDGRNGINGKGGTDVDLSGYAKESEILRPQVSEWSNVGVSLLDGTSQDSNNPLKYRVITLGKIHRVEVTGWVTTTIVGGRFNSKVRIPRMGFEDANKMSFSGGATLSAYGDIVSFFAGQPGEINFFSGSKTLNNANFQINCHWIYEE